MKVNILQLESYMDINHLAAIVTIMAGLISLCKLVYEKYVKWLHTPIIILGLHDYHLTKSVHYYLLVKSYLKLPDQAIKISLKALVGQPSDYGVRITCFLIRVGHEHLSEIEINETIAGNYKYLVFKIPVNALFRFIIEPAILQVGSLCSSGYELCVTADGMKTKYRKVKFPFAAYIVI